VVAGLLVAAGFAGVVLVVAPLLEGEFSLLAFLADVALALLLAFFASALESVR
jgi:hypothetical protein